MKTTATTSTSPSPSSPPVVQRRAKRPPPTEEEIEEARKRKKLASEAIPEGMLKLAWKKQQRKAKWEETKGEYLAAKREKKRAAVQRKKEALQNAKEEAEKTGDSTHYHQLKKGRSVPSTQKPTGVKFIMDCEFDDLMNDKEIVSLSNQITRAYSAKRHCEYDLPLTISSFNKNLKKRFDKSVETYVNWNGVEFKENSTLKEMLGEDLSDYVYLTADTDEVVLELESGKTYIIGGIVDKNRHKRLCVNKAKEMGLKVGKLPIDKYIEVNGRQVLATSHVYELCCKWFELDKSWEGAFNAVLPPRKVKKKSEDIEEENEEEIDGENEEENEEENEDETNGSDEEKKEVKEDGEEGKESE